jgi:hypothetical protein
MTEVEWKTFFEDPMVLRGLGGFWNYQPRRKPIAAIFG